MRQHGTKMHRDTHIRTKEAAFRFVDAKSGFKQSRRGVLRRGHQLPRTIVHTLE